MQIKYQGGDRFEIKAKEGEIKLSSQIAVENFVFPGPGEYEKNKIIIQGIADKENTIFVLNAEEMNICYLGHLNHELTEDEAKKIGDVDILFVPLGEEGTLNIKKAGSVISAIDPKIVIPMLFSSLEEFKKEEGLTDGEIELLKIKKMELPQEERKIVILKA